MSRRKFSISHLTDEQIAALAEAYPTAVETITIRKPVYKICAMLAQCKVPLPAGISFEAESKEEPIPDMLKVKK